jgi:hypothetical protein
MRFRSPLRAGIAALSLAAAAAPCLAAHWVKIGVSQPEGPESDTLLVDTDSLQIVGSWHVLDIMTRFAEPRPNKNDLVLDRYVQTTAFDCDKRTYALVRTVGYLGDQHFGSDHDVPNWQDKSSPVPDDSLTKRIFDIACSSAPPGAHH